MKERFGQPAVNMRRATLNEAIVDKAWCENVELHFEKRLVPIEVRDDRLVGTIFDADKPVLEVEVDGLAPGLVHDRVVERGAAPIHRRVTETRLHIPDD